MGLRVGLDLPQRLDPVDTRHIDVEQDHQGFAERLLMRTTTRFETVEEFLSVADPQETIEQAGALEIALHELGMAVVVFSEQDGDWIGGHEGWCATLIRSRRGATAGRGESSGASGKATKKVEPTPSV